MWQTTDNQPADAQRPRVRLSYTVETADGPSIEVTLPFVVGVLADLAGSDRETPLDMRRFVNVKPCAFDSLMSKIKPTLHFAVANALTDTEPLSIQLEFRSLTDFEPSTVARQVPEIAAAINARRELAALIACLDEAIPTAPDALAAALRRLSLHPAPSADVIALVESVAHSKGAADARRLATKALRAISTDSRWPGMDILARILGTAAHVAPLVADTSVALAVVRELDARLARQLTLILHHADFRRLEATWRGLSRLVDATSADPLLQVRVLDVSKQELSKSIRNHSGALWDHSLVFRKIYDEEYGVLGGEPYACLVGDYEFAHEANDVEVLRGISKIAAAAQVPFVAAAAPALLGMEGWDELPRPRHLSSIFESSDYARWRYLRETDESRYLCLTSSRWLVREPYRQHALADSGLSYSEEVASGEHTSFVWASPAYLMAANICRAQARYGWCAMIQGYASGGTATGLTRVTIEALSGNEIAVGPVEVSISDRRARELAECGLSALIQRQGSSEATFLYARTLFKSAQKEASSERDSLNDLSYVLPVTRFVQYVQCILRDRGGALATPDCLQDYLAKWLKGYVHEGDRTLDDPLRPLAGAAVKVDPSERDGIFQVQLTLRPRYQLSRDYPVTNHLEARVPMQSET